MTAGNGSVSHFWTPSLNTRSQIFDYDVNCLTISGAELSGTEVTTSATRTTISLLVDGTTQYFSSPLTRGIAFGGPDLRRNSSLSSLEVVYSQSL